MRASPLPFRFAVELPPPLQFTPMAPRIRSLLTLLDQISETLNQNLLADPITACPPSTLHLLPTRPAALIHLAHSKIHSSPFSEVPVCWRRLYTDASVAEAVRIARIEAEKEDGGEQENKGAGEDRDWIQEVVNLLDMAIIMSGAPERETMIEGLLNALQAYVEGECGNERPKKRRRIGEDVFPKSNGLEIPSISKPIPKRSAISMGKFEQFLPLAQPIVIQDALTHWPALHERPWKKPSYLLKKTLGGRRLVPVELGRSYTDEEWGQSIITFKEFMDRYMLHEPSSNTDNENADNQQAGIGYLAQHDLFAQVPSLRNDISTPDFCYTNPPPPASGTPLARKKEQPEKLEEPLLNAWFGPEGTVSPLHTDPYHNILCQVVGRKYVRLYSPFESVKLYAKGTEAGVDMSNTSEVDLADETSIDALFPLFRDAKYMETILEEGECLYVPVGWWHYVRSLSTSFSVSFWWN